MMMVVSGDDDDGGDSDDGGDNDDDDDYGDDNGDRVGRYFPPWEIPAGKYRQANSGKSGKYREILK